MPTVLVDRMLSVWSVDSVALHVGCNAGDQLRPRSRATVGTISVPAHVSTGPSGSPVFEIARRARFTADPKQYPAMAISGDGLFVTRELCGSRSPQLSVANNNDADYDAGHRGGRLRPEIFPSSTDDLPYDGVPAPANDGAPACPEMGLKQSGPLVDRITRPSTIRQAAALPPTLIVRTPAPFSTDFSAARANMPKPSTSRRLQLTVEISSCPAKFSKTQPLMSIGIYQTA